MLIQTCKIYKITNVETGSVLDCSGADNVSLIGYEWHVGDNQKWVAERDDDGWRLKCLRNDHFIGVDGLAEHGKVVTVVTEPFKWEIVADEENAETFRLFIPNTRLNLDLSDAANGTHVKLMPKWHPGKNQTWRFEEQDC